MLNILCHEKFESVRLIEMPCFQDDRGWMSRICDAEFFKAAGIPCDWAQTSHSHTFSAGVLRGIFVSMPPFQEAKMVRILRGRMQWILVDMRTASSTYGEWGEVMLDEVKMNAFYAPKGFAHGCLCLEDRTDLLLMADCPYSPEHSSGIRYDDPDIGIGWRIEEAGNIKISDSHRAYPSFRELSRVINPAAMSQQSSLCTHFQK